ncbi:MAG: mannose-1-phosphate guanylyltransferase, partial [Gemmatimonadales bacterium]
MRWAVILAGGSGSRFWPLSTPARPKQLLPLVDAQSTAEASLARLDGLVPPERILLVTGAHLAAPLQAALGLPADNVLIEPRAKSTAPALIWATHEAARRDPDATILSVHADWYVPDPAPFREAADAAFGLAEREAVLVTVGVTPTRPETGYGYIIPGAPIAGGGHRVTAFTEKPSGTRAAELIGQGALWNSGLFAWRSSVLRQEVGRVAPELDPGFAYLDRGDVAGFFDAAPSVAIDTAVLERSDAVATIEGRFSWDDIGTWEALSRVRDHDALGNVLVGDVTAVDATGVIAWSERTPIVVSGVSNLVVVEANGRILILGR